MKFKFPLSKKNTLMLSDNLWRKWFAWYPVRTQYDTSVTWWEYVERQVQSQYYANKHRYRWVHRNIMCPAARRALEVRLDADMYAQDAAQDGYDRPLLGVRERALGFNNLPMPVDDRWPEGPVGEAEPQDEAQAF